MTKIVKLLAFLITLAPLVRSECPAVNDTLSWSGPCTYEVIFNETECDLKIMGFTMETLKEACDAAAL
jgi:hypothetical protein